MRITALFIATAMLVASVAATSSARVASDLQGFMAVQREYISDAKAINLVNAPLIAIGEGPYPRIIEGISEVVELTDALNHGRYSGVTTGTGKSHKVMIDAFFKFADVQTKFLDILSAKATIVAKVPVVGQPVADALNRLQLSNEKLFKGFQNAGVTKGIMLLLGMTSLVASLLDAKPYINLQLVPHLTQYHQFWRILIHPFAFANSTELLVGEILLYNVAVGIEQSFGSRKYASFIVVSTVLSAVLSFCAIILGHKLGLNAIPAGPYGVIFSILWQYHRIVPPLYAFRIFGLELTNKALTWVLAIQLALASPPGSVLSALSGLVTGYLYRTDTPFLLPSLTRPRRLWRPLKAYRIPVSLHNLLARIFTPLIGNSSPPRRSNRVLPGQVRDAALETPAPPTGLGGLLAARAGLPTLAPTPVPAPEGAPTPPTGARGARAAMGEWVSGGTRAPTEQEIAALSNMFPNLSRDTIVRALQRSDFNTALAVEALLEHGA